MRAPKQLTKRALPNIGSVVPRLASPACATRRGAPATSGLLRPRQLVPALPTRLPDRDRALRHQPRHRDAHGPPRLFARGLSRLRLVSVRSGPGSARRRCRRVRRPARRLSTAGAIVSGLRGACPRLLLVRAGEGARARYFADAAWQPLQARPLLPALLNRACPRRTCRARRYAASATSWRLSGGSNERSIQE